MSRWDYDTVFYRVFCITLLAVALTFTVILTNVFVDIDGLLSKKDKVKPSKPTSVSINHDLSELSRVINVDMLPDDKSEDVYGDKDYQDSNDLYRSKRSLEIPDRPFHLKDPKLKKLLTSQLAYLLDELDEQHSNKKNNKKPTNAISDSQKNKNKTHSEILKLDKINYYEHPNLDKDKNKSKEHVGIKEYLQDLKEQTKKNVNSKTHKDYNAELLHLAMHNVIMQGMIENTDLDDVYKKVADLVKDFENYQSTLSKDEIINLFKNVNHKHTERSNGKTSSDELRNFKELFTKHDFNTKRSNIEATTGNNPIQRTTSKPKDNNLIIKTIIDITAMSNDRSNKDSVMNTKDKINGIIKLIYNGNVIKFKRMDDDNNTNSQTFTNKLDFRAAGNADKDNKHIGRNNKTKPNTSNQSYYQQMFYDYIKKIKESESSEQEKIFSSKRLKRHVKLKFETNKTPAKPKTNKEDDELFVEIETHFDSKGAKGEKKKKLIRDLIQKIQNAIHSDNNAHKKKQKHWHVKKRIQNPLSSKSAAVLLNKLILPFETLARRHLDPISKTAPLHEDMPLVTNVLCSNIWDKPYYSPRFFAKNINSAEMNTVDTDYSKVLSHNGIPQRLQKPLNSDMSDEVFEDSKIVNLGNINFLMKDIDGSGFSIGFNQYTDEAPDPETMKLFSGLENIIQTYHQQYDQESTRQQNSFDNDNVKNIPANDVDNNEEHIIRRRSIQNSEENEQHSSSYRIVYGHNLLPYKNYNEIFNADKSETSKVKKTKVYRIKSAKKSAFIIDENVFEKDLKPAEILSIADLLQRKKRSVKVKKISNVKIKSKMNRYLNTKKMASKSLFMNKKQTKRSKRQIDKIRIIARDLPEVGKSEEDNIFVLSDEKVFADRALVREVELPELEPNEKPHSIEHYDVITRQKEEEPYDIESQTEKVNEDPEEHIDIFSPYVYDVNPFENQNEFSRRARHNSLMSKYPHIIMEDTPRYSNHGEEFLIDNIQQQQFSVEATTLPAPTIIDIPSLNDHEITELITPPKDHSNYRVSVKIRPKNSTNMSGFKEVHTSINKSYNKNGLTYTSLVNVSQLSKVEKVNKTVSRRDNEEHLEQKENLKQQQDIIKTLIQQHKHRLEMQLKHLQSEKQKLQIMYNESPDNIQESVTEQVRPTNSKKGRKSVQEEGRKKVNRKTTTTVTTTKPTTTKPTTTVTTTTEHVQTTTDDIMKIKMIETIERNENITNELLKKIDQNTGVLKIFLGKLLSTIDITSKKPTEVTALKTEEENKARPDESSTNHAIMATKQLVENDHVDNNHIPFNFEDYHYIPNILLRNMPRPGNSSYGIPFVYAIQRPYGVNPDRDNIASMVYHGHIHTNPINDNNIVKKDMKNPAIKVVLKDKLKIVGGKNNLGAHFWKPKPGEKVLHDFVVDKNNSRFFLDDTRNDFTVVPLNDQTQNVFPVTINGTKV